MAAPSVAPTYAQYSATPGVCNGCGRKLAANYGESLWFVGGRRPAVYGVSCCKLLAAAHAA